MALQQLQYVLATFEHGSFSAAAQALHLAQPSLSEQVRRLEAELGRGGRGSRPPCVGDGIERHR
jgi:DNA-binding transcriptional LysR family regulator